MDVLRSLSQVPRGGGGDLLVVTENRIIWTGHTGTEFVPFEAIRSFSVGRYQHRYVLRLNHDETIRTEWVPKHRLLWWRWGNATAALPATEITFEVSRENTEAAQTIRSQLRTHRVPSALALDLPTPPPRDWDTGTFRRARF